MALLVNADVLEWAAEYEGAPFHAMLCDPPYELAFMGKDWDASGIAFDKDTWKALAAHLYPGAFGMAFASARGWHRLAVAIEDAGLIIHPSIFGWSYGSGFPKATRIDTQVDKAAGAEREIIGSIPNRMPQAQAAGWGNPGIDRFRDERRGTVEMNITTPATPLAAAWEGHRYGLQALKPALEPIIVFQRPYQGRPVDSITKTGAGALWIEGAKVGIGNDRISGGKSGDSAIWNTDKNHARLERPTGGRWPANLILQHTPECDEACPQECPVRRIGEQSGETSYTGPRKHNRIAYGTGPALGFQIKNHGQEHNDKGTAARFFYQSDWMAERLDEADPVRYCAKAGRKERDAGLGAFVMQERTTQGRDIVRMINRMDGKGDVPVNAQIRPARNPHPAIKPVALMRYLATLLLPPDIYAPRRLLVPFAGVASEMIGAHQAGWEEAIGIERDAEYCELGRARLAHWMAKPKQLGLPMFAQDEGG